MTQEERDRADAWELIRADKAIEATNEGLVANYTPKPLETAAGDFVTTTEAGIYSGILVRDAVDDTPQLGNTPVKGVPLVARPGSPGDSRPKIEIVGETSEPPLVFDACIIHDVSEQDAEKTDVIETFGAPHMFASGRFMRRFTFQGVVRAQPVNKDGSTLEVKVPQSVQLRNFYETYMRASAGAKNRTFTRVTLDNEVYEGHADTMNITRNADQEDFCPFVFTLRGQSRRHTNLDAELVRRLLSSGTQRNDEPLNPLQIEAEIEATQQESEVTASPATIDGGKITQHNQLLSGPTMRLLLDGVSGLLRVISNTPGIVPVYAGSGLPLNNSFSPVYGAVDLAFKITDYWALYSAFRERTPRANRFQGIRGAVNFQLRTADERSTRFTVNVELSPPVGFTLTKAQAFVNDVPASASFVYPIGNVVRLGEVTESQAFTEDGLPVDLALHFAATNGAPLSLDGATITFTRREAYAALGTGLRPVDEAVNFSFETTTTEGSDGVLLTHIDAEGSAPDYAAADRTVLRLRPVVTVVNQAPLTLPELLLSIYHGPSALKTALTSLLFLRAEWHSRTLKFLVKTDSQSTILRDVLASGALQLTTRTSYEYRPMPFASMLYDKDLAGYLITVAVDAKSEPQWLAATNIIQAKLLLPSDCGILAPGAWVTA